MFLYFESSVFNLNAMLVDDRTAHGAESFGDRLILFQSVRFPDWNSVIGYLSDEK